MFDVFALYTKPILNKFKNGPVLVKFPRRNQKMTLQWIYSHDYLIALNKYYQNLIYDYSHDINQYRSKTIKDYQKVGDYHKIYDEIF